VSESRLISAAISESNPVKSVFFICESSRSELLVEAQLHPTSMAEFSSSAVFIFKLTFIPAACFAVFYCAENKSELKNVKVISPLEKRALLFSLSLSLAFLRLLIFFLMFFIFKLA